MMVLYPARVSGAARGSSPSGGNDAIVQEIFKSRLQVMTKISVRASEIKKALAEFRGEEAQVVVRNGAAYLQIGDMLGLDSAKLCFYERRIADGVDIADTVMDVDVNDMKVFSKNAREMEDLPISGNGSRVEKWWDGAREGQSKLFARLNARALRSAMENATIAADKDGRLYPVLVNILFDASDGKDLNVVGSDGHVLSATKFKGAALGGAGSFLIRAKDTRYLIRSLAKAEEVSIYITGSKWVIFDIDGIATYSYIHHCDDKYPDYRGVIRYNVGKETVIFPVSGGAFMSAAKELSLSKGTSLNIRMDVGSAVTVISYAENECDNNSLLFRRKIETAGEIESRGDGMAIGFAGREFFRFAQCAANFGRARVELRDQTYPMVAEEGDSLILLMPRIMDDDEGFVSEMLDIVNS